MGMGAEPRKIKTRCYYTDYVNHMIRFYLTCPEKVQLDGKRRADIENWVAVQSVFHGLPENCRNLVITIYRKNFNLPKAVEQYCSETGADPDQVWMTITKVTSVIAKRRGLT